MATKVIGVDVGTSAVRAVELELSEPPVVRRFGQVALSEGAMQDGEVIDVVAVSAALRRLWEAVGFTSKSVRVGLASARMIIRIIEMPRLSDDELRSAIRLQLEDYVPLAADETVFDIQPLEPLNTRPGKGSKRPEVGAQPPQQLLLAAAHRNAVLPLIEAVRGAGLKLDAVDVVPAALARTFARSSPQQDRDVDEHQDDADAGVDLIVSIGAGTVTVVAARLGAPVFVRTLTNISGRRVTEQIAARLALTDVEAERRKRSNVIDVEDIAELTAARDAADPGVAELVEEVRDSIAYYAGQDGARPIRRLVLTGGGAQLSGLADEMADHLNLPVEQLDPFAGMKFAQFGFEPEDLPFLAPYAGAALGLALAGRSTKSDRLDLTPSTKEESGGRRKPMLAVGGAVLVVAGFGALYLHRSSAIGEERSTVEALTAQMVDVQTQINALRTTGGPGASTERATPQAVVESVAGRDVDWVAAHDQLDALGVPFGVAISALQGVAEPFETPAVIADSAPGAATTVPAPVDPNAPVTVGRYSITATAADLNAVAAWLDAVTADPRFAQAWVNGTTTAQLVGGTTAVQFTADVRLTDANLVRRAYAPAPDGQEASS